MERETKRGYKAKQDGRDNVAFSSNSMQRPVPGGEPRKTLIISSMQGYIMEYFKKPNYLVQSVSL